MKRVHCFFLKVQTNRNVKNAENAKFAPVQQFGGGY